MGKTVAQLTESMESLEKRGQDLGELLYQAFGDYLKVVGGSLGQQMIMASYYVCTESYPDQFLNLGHHQRQILQDTLRVAAKQMAPDLLGILRDPSGPDALPKMDDRPAPSIQAEEAASLEEELKALLSMDTLLDLPQIMKPAPRNGVERLGVWYQSMEQETLQVIRQASQQINQILQKFEILPRQIPAPVLEAAALAEGGESSRISHVVKLRLEAVDPRDILAAAEASAKEDAEEKESKHRRKRDGGRLGGPVLSIVAVQLRLAELEFKDSQVMAQRNRIRDLVGQLRSLSQEYQRLERECAVAKAQDAWRATWFNE
jgi:hypothetical protein